MRATRAMRRGGWLGTLLFVFACAPKQGPDGGVSPATSPLVFEDVTASVGLPLQSSGCSALRDFDLDGRPDVLLSPLQPDGSATKELWLFLNHSVAGSVRFDKVVVPTPGYVARSCAVGDYDGDGRPDVVIAGGLLGHSAFLLHNTGDAGAFFEDKSGLLPLDPDTGALPTISAGWVDLDGDGRLDLLASLAPISTNTFGPCTDDPTLGFSCAANPPYTALGPIFFHNLGGTFERKSLLPASTGLTNGFGFIDWDGDGRVDVFEPNDFGVSRFWRNPGDLTVGEDWLQTWGVAQYQHGMGVAFGDFNGDSLLDVYLSDIGLDDFLVGKSGGTAAAQPPSPAAREATLRHSGWCPQAQDFDNDGRLDLHVLQSALAASQSDLAMLTTTNQPLASDMPLYDLTLRQTDDAQLTVGKVARRSTRSTIAYGATSSGDFDGDGRVDLLTVVSSITFEVRLLRNTTDVTGRHWVAVRLQGRSADRDAVGARVRVLTGGRRMEQVAGAHGGLGNSSNEVHFGLGAATAVDAIEVVWPGGKTQRIAGPLPSDRVLDVMQD